ncbi:hypothetical protein FQN57_007045 [Myotisia sp. PD_48]|nr:hypothetical protein FQN57_007045 [Myotisia sp. PD_48]
MAQIENRILVLLFMIYLTIIRIKLVSCAPIPSHQILESSCSSAALTLRRGTFTIPFQRHSRGSYALGSFLAPRSLDPNAPLYSRGIQSSKTSKSLLQTRQKLAIGLGAGVGSLGLLAIMALIGYKRRWLQKLLPRRKIDHNASEDNHPNSISTQALPRHPLYRDSIRPSSTAVPGSVENTPRNQRYHFEGSPASHQTNSPSPITSFFQPVEIYRKATASKEIQASPKPSLASSPSPQFINPLRCHSSTSMNQPPLGLAMNIPIPTDQEAPLALTSPLPIYCPRPQRPSHSRWKK